MGYLRKKSFFTRFFAQRTVKEKQNISYHFFRDSLTVFLGVRIITLADYFQMQSSSTSIKKNQQGMWVKGTCERKRQFLIQKLMCSACSTTENRIKREHKCGALNPLSRFLQSGANVSSCHSDGQQSIQIASSPPDTQLQLARDAVAAATAGFPNKGNWPFLES